MAKQAKNTIAFGTIATPRMRRDFTPKPFPIPRWCGAPGAGRLSVREERDVLTVEFTVMGIPCIGLNGGPEFKHNEAFSFQVRNR